MAFRRVRFAQRRIVTGYSQESLAKATGVDPRTVKRWESAASTPHAGHRRKLAELLQVSLEQLNDLLTDTVPVDDASRLDDAAHVVGPVAGLPDEHGNGAGPSDSLDTQDAAHGQEVSWLHRRDFLSVVTGLTMTAGTDPIPHDPHDRLNDLVPNVQPEPLRRVGQTDVARIEATTKAFRDWDDRWGGGLSRAAVIAQLQWVDATAKQAVCSSDVVEKLLLGAMADLAGVAAFMSYDVLRHEEARRLWMLGLAASRQAGDLGLMGMILRQLAHQALHLDRPHEAQRLLRLASATTAAPGHGKPEFALAEISAYEGWCYAAMGKVQACHRALGQSEEHFADARDDDRPLEGQDASSQNHRLGHLDSAELQGLRGRSYHLLAYHVPETAAHAEPLLRDAVAGRGSGYLRVRTLNLIDLSATFFQRREDVEEGAVLGNQALDGAATLNSPRTLDRLRVLEPLSAPFADEPAVTRFRHRLHHVLASA